MNESTVIALGFFDGVHIGHAALLDRCKTLAREENYRAGVVTFAAHPDTLVLGNTPPLINTPYDREKLLRERFSMEQVVTLPFDEQMHTMPWRDFLHMLIRDYGSSAARTSVSATGAKETRTLWKISAGRTGLSVPW